MKKCTTLLLLALLLGLSGCGEQSFVSTILDRLGNPLGLAIHAGGQVMYVVNTNGQVLYSSSSLGVVDLTSNTIMAGKSVPTDSFSSLIALNGSNAFVTNRFTNNDADGTPDKILVFDTSTPDTPALLQSSTAGEDPFGIAISTVGTITGLATNLFSGVLSFFNLTAPFTSSTPVTLSVLATEAGDTATFTTPAFGYSEVAVNGSGTRAVLTNSVSNVVLIIDLAAQEVEAVIQLIDNEVGANTRGLFIDGDTLYLARRNPDELLVFDLSTIPDDAATEYYEHTETTLITLFLGSLALPGDPAQIVMNTVSDTAYVSLASINQVAVVDVSTPATPSLTTSLTVGAQPYGMAICTACPAPATGRVYVANFLGHSISVIDEAGPTVIATITTP